MKRNMADKTIFNIIGYMLVGLVSVLAVFPLLLILSGSLTEESAIYTEGYSFIPRGLTLEAYSLAFKAPLELLNAYAVTAGITLLGTSAGLFITAMTAYVIQRKDVRFRNIFSFYFYFTTLFSGGLVPWYIMMVSWFHMKNNPLALLLPPLINVFNILIMKGFFKSIPDAISEAAVIDGAGDFRIFTGVILPVSKPALATVGLYIGLAYWNDWYNAMLFIEDKRLVPLQYYLYSILNKMEALNTISASSGVPIPEMPKESFKLAITMISVIPALLVYPFAQKVFMKGVSIGAVKG